MSTIPVLLVTRVVFVVISVTLSLITSRGEGVRKMGILSYFLPLSVKVENGQTVLKRISFTCNKRF